LTLLNDESVREGARAAARIAGGPLSHIRVTAEKVREDSGLAVTFLNGAAEIKYGRPRDFFRALGLLAAAADAGRTELHIAQRAPFEKIGVMYDCSRNSVPKAGTVREILARLALAGFDAFMLYTEDIYEIPQYPAFGHYRGRYSAAELKEMDDAAAVFGIELIPCIQTLAHLERFLQWGCAEPMRDTPEVLYVGRAETARFVEAAVTAASAPVRSKRIHLGMDEAHGLGLGARLSERGYARKLELMKEHLALAARVCAEKGLSPMIWGDMPFRENIPGGGYYSEDVELPDCAECAPEGVRLVYWDYYHNDKKFYDRYIAQYRRIGAEPIFAGGVCSWTAMAPNLPKTMLTAGAGVASCAENGVGEIFVCGWKDSGGEAPPGIDMLGFMMFSEFAYAGADSPDIEAALAVTCPLLCGAPYGDLMLAGSLDHMDGSFIGELEPANPSRYFLWQDPLLGRFDLETGYMSFGEYYGKLARRLEKYADGGEGFAAPHLRLVHALCRVLELKAEFGARAKAAYDAGDRPALARLAETAATISGRVRDLRTAHMDAWFQWNKPFGWDAADIKYGGLLMRLEYTAGRLGAFASGEADSLPELEEERLTCQGARPGGDKPRPPHANEYTKIVTVAAL
jgi:hypothetical protein